MTSLTTRNGHTTFPSIFKDFHKEMSTVDRLFDSMFQNMMPSNRHFNLNQTSFNPHIDLLDNEDSFVMVAEMPGMTEEDFTLSIDGDMLFLSGEKKASYADAMRREIRHGAFMRKIHLKDVDNLEVNDITADFVSGILTVTIPKRETVEGTERRQIAINSR